MKTLGLEWNNSDKIAENIDKEVLKKTCSLICEDFNNKPGRIIFNIVSDDELWKMNVKFLNHENLTDVITFPYNNGEFINGEIFISYDRAADNAKINKTDTEKEIIRYVFHGVLHLNGLDDETQEQKQIIHDFEEKYMKKYYEFQGKR